MRFSHGPMIDYRYVFITFNDIGNMCGLFMKVFKYKTAPKITMAHKVKKLKANIFPQMVSDLNYFLF